MRRNLFIAAVVGVGLLVLGGALYFFTQSRNSSQAGTQKNTDFFSALFPFTGNTAPAATDQSHDTNGAPQVVPRLRLVSDKPVSGAEFVKASATTTDIRFMERETGHVYDTATDALTSVRLSNTTIPGVEEVVWAGESNPVLRALEDSTTISNFLATIRGTTTEQSIDGKFIGNYSRLVATPDGRQLFGLMEDLQGSHVESLQVSTLKKQTVFSSSFRSWIPLASQKTLFVETAPVSGLPGFVYSVAADGSLEKVAEGPGLMALVNQDGTYVAYSSSSGGRTALIVVNVKTHEQSTMPLTTLAPKCAWLPTKTPQLFCGVPKLLGESLPDAWLVGSTSFDDAAWIIDAQSGTTTMVSDIGTESGTPIDVLNPIIDGSGTYALFMNKDDLKLWSLRLPETTSTASQ